VDGVRSGRGIRLIFEILISTYFALLAVAASVSSGSRYNWILDVRSWYLSIRSPHAARGIDDVAGLRFTAFVLVWLLAAAIFVLLRALQRVSLIPRTVPTLCGGLVATLGLPLAYVYSHGGFMLTFYVELLFCLVAVILCSLGKWVLSPPASLLLLVLHFGFWTCIFLDSFSMGFLLIWPGWDHSISRTYFAPALYSVLGLCCAVAWFFKLNAEAAHPRPTRSE
jgi:hypothetical protein